MLIEGFAYAYTVMLIINSVIVADTLHDTGNKDMHFNLRPTVEKVEQQPLLAGRLPG
jgi:hypothetical protein